MHKHKNLIIFLILTLLRSAFIGLTKFWLWSYLQEYRSLEEIAGFISLGGIISYLIGGAVAYAFTKKKITIVSAIVAAICLLAGHYTDYTPFIRFTVLLSIVGLVYGLWLIIKSIILTIEILESGLSETIINGAVNLSILIGLVAGSYYGFVSYAKLGENGFWIIIGLLVLCGLFTLGISYDKEFHPLPLLSTLKKSIPKILDVTEKYFRLLVPIGVLWAVSTAIAQKMLEIGIDIFNKVPKASISILLVSFAGSALGFAISALFKKNKRLVTIIVLLIFGVSTILFPHLLSQHNNYLFLKRYSFGLGLVFGIAVNILEGRFFHLIGDDDRKEYGSAAYGLITGIIMFFIMITTHLLTQGVGSKFAFFFCGIVILVNVFFMGHLKKR